MTETPPTPPAGLPPVEPTPDAAAYEPIQPAPVQPAYAPAQPASPQPGYGYPQGGAPSGPVVGGPTPGGFTSGRGKTIGLIVAGVVAVGALGGLGAAVFGGDDSSGFSGTTDTGTATGGGGAVQPVEDVSPSGGGILDPSPIGSATPAPSSSVEPTPEPDPTDAPSTGSVPTEGPSPTLDPDSSGGSVVTIANGVQVAVLDGWDVVGQGDSDVLLADGANSYVYALTGIVSPSSDAAAVISGSLDNVLPKQSYTQLKKTDIAPLEAFGSVVSIAAFQYQATWVDQQSSVPLQGLLICAIRQDGTAMIITAEHSPPKEFQQSSDSWAPVVDATLGLFGSS